MTEQAGWRIRAQGDRCLVVSFGQAIDPAVGERCLALSALLRKARLPGVIDVVPSFAAVAVHYAPLPDGSGPTFEALSAQLQALLAGDLDAAPARGRVLEIPVCYGGEHGPDLQAVAQAQGLAPEQIVAAHSGEPCRVYMLGFAPGHPYIGLHGPALDVPRRTDPRTEVPAGSVAIANRQTVIYPSKLPGGWNILGATPLPMFDPRRDPPALLAPGDTVRFVPISEARFRQLRAQQQG
ncbi:5-oxoprolinase subunit PxpB [Orrella sp. JC864]|uniref:5-oxoprolinase subunit PxpB n=1 Tax=Orrella sp. JC864 TaxID=3120298 RepID=UPI0012BD74DA